MADMTMMMMVTIMVLIMSMMIMMTMMVKHGDDDLRDTRLSFFSPTN